jgi:hypothetical protein
MRKAIKGLNYNFIWDCTAPVVGIPTLTIGNTTYNLIKSTPDLIVNSISNDRRSITLSASANSLKPYQNNAFLMTDADNYFPIQVLRIVDTSLILGTQLPREVSFQDTAIIQFSNYSVNIPANDLPLIKTYTYSIDYVQNFGGQEINRNEKGIIKVCKRPFNTGLDHNRLVNSFPQIADKLSRNQTDFNEQIKTASEELALYVRDLVLPKECDEDDVHNPEMLLNAHSYLSLAIIYELLGNLETAEKFRARGIELADLTMRTISLDLNKNDEVDLGEENLRQKGGNRGDLRGNFAGRVSSEYEDRYKPSRSFRH